MKDLVYIYDKDTLVKSELGEIQSNFNQNFVIDGTKDSNKVIVYNFSGIEVEPYSIVKHQATKTWWIVSHDKVSRYKNEDGYYYQHELELQGAIELLNARDLVDSGFNQNRYTILQFFDRLLKHSNFDLKDKDNNEYQIDFRNNIDPNKQCDYVKTYQNYTLLSALRDLFDSYNCDIKLDFQEDSTHIVQALFYVVSKTGNVNDEPLSENIFNNVDENKTIDKNSFGTTVISNAENVISTKAKTFPTTGVAKITGTTYNIIGGDNSTAVVRLPSDIFKVNWVDLYFRTTIWLEDSNGTAIARANFYSYDDNSIQNAYNTIKNALPNDLQQDFNDNFPMVEMYNYGKRRIPYTDKYDAISNVFMSDYAIPQWDSQGGRGTQQLVVTNSDLRPNIKEIDNAIFYERGKNLIEGFSFFGDKGIGNRKARLLPLYEGIVYSGDSGVLTTYYVGIGTTGSRPNYTPQIQEIEMSRCGCVVNYIPMADIKIKVDNNGERKDSKLYNQNGKLTDSVSLSRSLLSYSKEIESDTITKYGTFYAKYSGGALDIYENNIPNVGRLVTIGNDLYVINNVSLDFYQNECDDTDTEIGYYIKGEFTLSKNVATKSALVNPNTNIRDYGIPQDKNVARKQLYRDFYELGHRQVSDNTNWYLPLDKVLNVGVNYSPYQDHIAIIKLEFNGSFGGTPQNRWFYQLESTTFILKKSVYEIIDFRDNNIIGYGSQNVYSGFDITRLLTNTYDYINTPISYVDDNGEFKDIDIKLCTNKQVGEIYESYKTATGQNFDNSSYNAFYSCFIPSEVYGEYWDSNDNQWKDNNYGAKNDLKHDFAIVEINYEKDALEVPVFEYSCQIDDSDQVLIGSNILDNYETDSGYLYQYLFVEKNKYNDNNYGIKRNDFLTISIDQNNVATMSTTDTDKGYCELEYVNGKLTIKLYSSVTLDLNTKTITSRGTQRAFDTNYDLMIIRNRILEEDLYHDIVGELSILSVVSPSGFGTPTASDYYKYRVGTDDNYYHCEVETPSGTILGELLDDTNIYTINSIPTTTQSNRTKSVAVRLETPPTPNDTYVITGGTNSSNMPYGSDTPYYMYSNYDNHDNMPSGVNDRIVVAQLRYVNSDYTLATTNVEDLYDYQQPSASGTGGQRCVTSRIFLTDYYNGSPIILAYAIVFDSIYSARARLTRMGESLKNGMCVAINENTQVRFYYCSGGYNQGGYYTGYTLTDTGKIALSTSGYGYQLSNTGNWYLFTNDFTFEAVVKKYIEWEYNSGWQNYGAIPDTSSVYYLANNHTFYKWNGSSFYQITPTNYTVTQTHLYRYTNGSWNNDINSNRNYHQLGTSNKWYMWSGSSWSYHANVDKYYYYTGLVVGQPFQQSAELQNNNLFSYGYQYRKWQSSSHTFIDDTDYKWVLGSSASNQYFTYNNTLYQYNSTNNQFEQKSSQLQIDREDLMFVIKDMVQADISSNILSLYINYYKVD